jgi:hypothetical protein
LDIISHFQGGKAVSIDGILDKAFSVPLVTDYVNQKLWNLGLTGTQLRDQSKL